jgi:hypothetical protein
MLCDGGELWSGSAGQLRSWSVLERKEEGTGGNQGGRRARVKGGFFCWKADRIFPLRRSRTARARVRVNQGGWTEDEQSHSVDLIDPTE